MTVTITINMIITSFLGIVTIIDGKHKNVEVTSQWLFQEPKLEVPTIYKAYIRPEPQNHQPDFFLKATGGRLQTIPAIFSTKSLTKYPNWWNWVRQGHKLQGKITEEKHWEFLWNYTTVDPKQWVDSRSVLGNKVKRMK